MKKRMNKLQQVPEKMGKGSVKRSVHEVMEAAARRKKKSAGKKKMKYAPC